jgi:hypothetical protein
VDRQRNPSLLRINVETARIFISGGIYWVFIQLDSAKLSINRVHLLLGKPTVAICWLDFSASKNVS